MTEQEFRKKYVGKAVHCDTEEKAKELLKLAHSFGWKGFNGNVLIENKDWLFLEEYNCYLFDLDKTTLRSSYKFYKSKGYEIIEFESEENKVKTKKVFDLGLYVDGMKKEKRSDREIMFSIKTWALECHGLTVKEMNEKDYFILPSWMKEVEAEYELSEKEIEFLKALKVLGFEWIARDENNSLNTYEVKPIKGDEYYYEGDYITLKPTLFKFISWKDEEATSVEELLKYA